MSNSDTTDVEADDDGYKTLTSSRHRIQPFTKYPPALNNTIILDDDTTKHRQHALDVGGKILLQRSQTICFFLLLFYTSTKTRE
ncbi:hypothetical protein V6N12_023119 [Hibiscus sabdariffa]|uniref:Uncharacterized protein n=1 Tax=Hibiscus sabdariffa TaxID=183260 RepID=A0ABR2FWQ4_9ROSI